jgi:LPXTG-site transpeptidase (sortase) family protein
MEVPERAPVPLHVPRVKDLSGWTIEGEVTAKKPEKQERKQPKKSFSDAQKKLFAALQGKQDAIWREIHTTITETAEESARQYRTSAASAVFSLRGAAAQMKQLSGRTWAVLAQPVWVLKKDKEPKEYTRITLFVLDTVRFGTTFAAIFVALFFTLNYQSFFEIAKTHMNPLEHARSVQALTASVDATLKDKLLKSPGLAVAGLDEGSLLSFLPEVGPPENRIIIPKLELNVPLVTPSFDALLREDWAQVETDIQDALQAGVVHYPGTAKPGQAGNFFVTGHSSYYPWAPGQYKTVFARLHELEPGDEYWVYHGGDRHRYIVRGKKEVKPSDVTVLDQPIDKRIATLMTCTPIGTTLRRLIITAEEVDPETGIALEIGEKADHPIEKTRTPMLPI